MCILRTSGMRGRNRAEIGDGAQGVDRRKRCADRFYVGTKGGFDDAVYRTLKTMRRHYPHIEYKRVLAYLPTALEQGDKAEQADTLIPAGIETRPPRYRILYRNEWMLRQADYVVVYTVTSAGGAAKFAALARKRGIPCINLAEN